MFTGDKPPTKTTRTTAAAATHRRLSLWQHSLRVTNEKEERKKSAIVGLVGLVDGED